MEDFQKNFISMRVININFMCLNICTKFCCPHVAVYYKFT